MVISAPQVDAHVIAMFLDNFGGDQRLVPRRVDDTRSTARLAEVRAEIIDTGREFASAGPAILQTITDRMTRLRETEARILTGRLAPKR